MLYLESKVQHVTSYFIIEIINEKLQSKKQYEGIG